MTLRDLDKFLLERESKLTAAQRTLVNAAAAAAPPAYPFNEYEYRISFLLEHDCISFIEYEEVRSLYLTGNAYLNLYGLAPRTFGETWGQQHIVEIDDRFKPASRKLDAAFDGEYDLRIEDFKIEVKAARAYDNRLKGEPLTARALRFNSDGEYWMNFQQLKPDLCDIFIFIGVWVDVIIYWVLTSSEAKENPYVSVQHRGGIEFQIGIRPSNRDQFRQYAVPRAKLAETVLQKSRK